MIGNIIGVVVTGIATCAPAGKYGVEQFVALRSQFGTQGSRLVYVLAVVFLTMGWLAVLAMMFGRSIDGLTSIVSNTEASPTGIKMTIAASGAIVLAWFIVAKGPTSIKLFNMVVSPALALLMAWMLYLLLSRNSFADLMAMQALDPPFEDKTLNFIIAIEVNLAAGFSWWPYIGNLARLTKNERTAIWPNVIGIFGAATLGEIVGLLAAVALGESDPTVWMTQIGGLTVGLIALGFVAFANITSMANILYTSIVGLRQIGTSGLRTLRWDVIVGAFCIVPLLLVLVYPGMYDGFFIFLVWTSALNSALAGIGIADYFFLRGQKLDLRGLYAAHDQSPYRFASGFNPAGLIALLTGFLVYVLIFNPQTLESAAVFKYLTASIPSCLAAGLVHYVLTKAIAAPRGWGAYPKK